MINKGDIGAIIRIEPRDGTDISMALTPKILYRKPSMKTGAWTATIATNAVQYTTLTAADIDEVGVWQLQASVDMIAWEGTSSIVNLNVGEKIIVVP